MFYDKGLKFECTRCSDCCRLSPGYVYLSHSDLKKLCEWFKLPQKEFIDSYCRWVQYYDNTEVLCLKEKSNYDCTMWKSEGGCSAYGARPVQCSTYPFWSWMLKDKQSWDECEKDCPGINKGRVWSKEEIEVQKNLYDGIEPVHRYEIEPVK
ncbi:MAG: YkgJ family cysteine cluster protein [Treponema sp.]|nr:YkgJ family cysteine cluster protein [Candidatus Treponema equifaecale]